MTLRHQSPLDATSLSFPNLIVGGGWKVGLEVRLKGVGQGADQVGREGVAEHVGHLQIFYTSYDIYVFITSDEKKKQEKAYLC